MWDGKTKGIKKSNGKKGWKIILINKELPSNSWLVNLFYVFESKLIRKIWFIKVTIINTSTNILANSTTTCAKSISIVFLKAFFFALIKNTSLWIQNFSTSVLCIHLTNCQYCNCNQIHENNISLYTTTYPVESEETLPLPQKDRETVSELQ